MSAAVSNGFDAELIRRYDARAPRYTSYPTADRFHPGFGPSEHHCTMRNRSDAPLSLYVHIPFCPSPCFYCGCHREITRQAEPVEDYLEALEREITLKAALLDNPGPVIQVHFGGGSPSFLSSGQLGKITHALRAAFTFAPEVEMGIEVDPRNLRPPEIASLRELGFNRLSVGVQDFDPLVQAAINRRQSYAETAAVVQGACQAGFASVSLDLVYGLPHQHPTRFEATLDQVLALQPDRVSLYSYAHLPERFKAQRRIPASSLPDPSLKLRLLEQAVERLTENNYIHIGMDHFARPNDPLAKSLNQGTLHRNFQGYSTQGGCDLIGFGVSAISEIGPCYAQNTKDLQDYQTSLRQGILPVRRGIALTREDRLRQEVIQALMCQGRVCYHEIHAHHGVEFSTYFAEELLALEAAMADGLVSLTPEALEVTPRGRYLLRAIALPFDAYLHRNRAGSRHSRLI